MSLLNFARSMNASIRNAITNCEVLTPPARKPGPFPDRMPDMMSATAAKPYPLWLPFSRVPPNGSMWNWPYSGVSTRARTGAPSRSQIQPGSSFEPMRRVKPSLLAATCVVATSNTNGGISSAGAAQAIGCVPNAGSEPNVGTMIPPPAETMQTPIMSRSIAISG